jgi:predicted site-specific integrase-resolvase
VGYLKVSSTTKKLIDTTEPLYDSSLSVTYRKTVVYLKVSSTNKTD